MVDGIEPHPAAYPVPPQTRDLRRPRAGEQQQPGCCGGLPVVRMVEDEAEALQLVQREEPLARGRPVAPHVAAGVRALGTKVPQLGLPHHDRKHRQGPIGVAGRAAQGIEPPPHVGAVGLRDAHIAKEGDEMAVDQMAVAFARGRLPAPPLAAYEVLHEVGEQRTGLGLGVRGRNGREGFVSRLGGGHLVRRAEDRLGHADRPQGPDDEGLGSVLRDGEAEPGQIGVNDSEAVSSGFFSRKVRRTVRSLMVAWMRMAVSPLSVPSGAIRSKGTERRFWTDNVARAGDRGQRTKPA